MTDDHFDIGDIPETDSITKQSGPNPSQQPGQQQKKDQQSQKEEDQQGQTNIHPNPPQEQPLQPSQQGQTNVHPNPQAQTRQTTQEPVKQDEPKVAEEDSKTSPKVGLTLVPRDDGQLFFTDSNGKSYTKQEIDEAVKTDKDLLDRYNSLKAESSNAKYFKDEQQPKDPKTKLEIASSIGRTAADVFVNANLPENMAQTFNSLRATVSSLLNGDVLGSAGYAVNNAFNNLTLLGDGVDSFRNAVKRNYGYSVEQALGDTIRARKCKAEEEKTKAALVEEMGHVQDYLTDLRGFEGKPDEFMKKYFPDGKFDKAQMEKMGIPPELAGKLDKVFNATTLGVTTPQGIYGQYSHTPYSDIEKQAILYMLTTGDYGYHKELLGNFIRSASSYGLMGEPGKFNTSSSPYEDAVKNNEYYDFSTELGSLANLFTPRTPEQRYRDFYKSLITQRNLRARALEADKNGFMILYDPKNPSEMMRDENGDIMTIPVDKMSAEERRILTTRMKMYDQLIKGLETGSPELLGTEISQYHGRMTAERAAEVEAAKKNEKIHAREQGCAWAICTSRKSAAPEMDEFVGEDGAHVQVPRKITDTKGLDTKDKLTRTMNSIKRGNSYLLQNLENGVIDLNTNADARRFVTCYNAVACMRAQDTYNAKCEAIRSMNPVNRDKLLEDAKNELIEVCSNHKWYGDDVEFHPYTPVDLVKWGADMGVPVRTEHSAVDTWIPDVTGVKGAQLTKDNRGYPIFTNVPGNDDSGFMMTDDAKGDLMDGCYRRYLDLRDAKTRTESEQIAFFRLGRIRAWQLRKKAIDAFTDDLTNTEAFRRRYRGRTNEAREAVRKALMDEYSPYTGDADWQWWEDSREGAIPSNEVASLSGETLDSVKEKLAERIDLDDVLTRFMPSDEEYMDQESRKLYERTGLPKKIQTRVKDLSKKSALLEGGDLGVIEAVNELQRMTPEDIKRLNSIINQTSPRDFEWIKSDGSVDDIGTRLHQWAKDLDILVKLGYLNEDEKKLWVSKDVCRTMLKNTIAKQFLEESRGKVSVNRRPFRTILNKLASDPTSLEKVGLDMTAGAYLKKRYEENLSKLTDAQKKDIDFKLIAFEDALDDVMTRVYNSEFPSKIPKKSPKDTLTGKKRKKLEVDFKNSVLKDNPELIDLITTVDLDEFKNPDSFKVQDGLIVPKTKFKQWLSAVDQRLNDAEADLASMSRDDPEYESFKKNIEDFQAYRDILGIYDIAKKSGLSEKLISDLYSERSGWKDIPEGLSLEERRDLFIDFARETLSKGIPLGNKARSILEIGTRANWVHLVDEEFKPVVDNVTIANKNVSELADARPEQDPAVYLSELRKNGFDTALTDWVKDKGKIMQDIPLADCIDSAVSRVYQTHMIQDLDYKKVKDLLSGQEMLPQQPRSNYREEVRQYRKSVPVDMMADEIVNSPELDYIPNCTLDEWLSLEAKAKTKGYSEALMDKLWEKSGLGNERYFRVPRDGDTWQELPKTGPWSREDVKKYLPEWIKHDGLELIDGRPKSLARLTVSVKHEQENIRQMKADAQTDAVNSFGTSVVKADEFLETKDWSEFCKDLPPKSSRSGEGGRNTNFKVAYSGNLGSTGEDGADEIRATYDQIYPKVLAEIDKTFDDLEDVSEEEKKLQAHMITYHIVSQWPDEKKYSVGDSMKIFWPTILTAPKNRGNYRSKLSQAWGKMKGVENGSFSDCKACIDSINTYMTNCIQVLNNHARRILNVKDIVSKNDILILVKDGKSYKEDLESKTNLVDYLARTQIHVDPKNIPNAKAYRSILEEWDKVRELPDGDADKEAIRKEVKKFPKCVQYACIGAIPIKGIDLNDKSQRAIVERYTSQFYNFMSL